MIRTLIKHGNSLALIIDKPIPEMLHIFPEPPLELSTNGDAILIAPVRDLEQEKKLRASLEKINEQYGEDLRWLAE